MLLDMPLDGFCKSFDAGAPLQLIGCAPKSGGKMVPTV